MLVILVTDLLYTIFTIIYIRWYKKIKIHFYKKYIHVVHVHTI